MIIEIKQLTENDFETFFSLIEALAAYEHLDPPNIDAKVRLKRDAFLPNPRFEGFLAILDGEPVGYAIVFETYSSFCGKPTLYLEDFFVLPKARKQRVGYTLFRFLSRYALEKDCGRMEWQVLNWNTLAIDFYERIGAKHQKDWLPYRLNEDDLARLNEK